MPSAPDWPAVARDLEDWVDDEEVVERLDPVPRVLDGAEWDVVAAGLAQRVRALEAFLRRPGEAVAAGVVPADLVPTSPYAEHRHAPDLPPPVVPVGLAGPDLARDADGAWWVLEDNLRNPTMLWHSVALAAWLRPRLERPPGLRPAIDPPGAALADVLGRMLRAAAPGVPEPVVAVLSNDHTWHPHSETLGLAELVSVPCVQLGDLRRGPGDRLLLPDGRAVDVLWRRTSEERLHDDHGRPNRLGEALLGPLRAGTVAVVNPFGTGVADDKRMLAHADDLVRLHLGEEPLIGAPETWDLGHPDHLAAALPLLGELVLKPRSGSGGNGVSLPDDPDRTRRAAALDAVRAEPAGWVAQRPVVLERVPAWTGREVAWRPVDLRAFVVSTGEESWVLTGGASRASAGDGRVTNLSQGGGSKDTWVVDGASAVAVGSEDPACDLPTD
jgi:uncharacterized circularly permuted ATP-grasp superfamily protein